MMKAAGTASLHEANASIVVKTRLSQRRIQRLRVSVRNVRHGGKQGGSRRTHPVGGVCHAERGRHLMIEVFERCCAALQIMHAQQGRRRKDQKRPEKEKSRKAAER